VKCLEKNSDGKLQTVYRNPEDITKIFLNNVEENIVNIIINGIKEFDDKDYIPIVKSEEYPVYNVDLFWLVKEIAEYMRETTFSDESVDRFLTDFGTLSKKTYPNLKFFISYLELNKLTILGKKSGLIWPQLLKINDTYFRISTISINADSFTKLHGKNAIVGDIDRRLKDAEVIANGSHISPKIKDLNNELGKKIKVKIF